MSNAYASEPPCTRAVVTGGSIQKALHSAAGGDVICVHPGIYHETVTIALSGTQTAPIIIRGEGGRPIIDGQYTLPKENVFDYSRPRQGCPGTVLGREPDGTVVPKHFECTGYYPLVRIAGSFVTFEGFEVVNSTGVGISAVASAAAKDLMTNITIRNNYVHSTRASGIALFGAVHSSVEHNEVSDTGNYAPFWRIGPTLMAGSGVGAFGSHFIDFVSNVIHDNWGDALLVDINTGGSTDVNVEDNIFYENFSSNGVYAHAVKRMSMQRNLTYCATNHLVPSSTSLRVAPTERQYSQDIDAVDIVVRNNVFANCPKAGILLWNTKPGVRLISNFVFANNTIYGDGDSLLVSDSVGTFVQDSTLDNNLIVNGTFSVSGLHATNNKVVAPGEETGLRGLNGDGKFPTQFTAGEVDPQWFRLKQYNGVGADLSGFAEAGIRPVRAQR